eukprot:symbB.v1.2.000950.t1/scaffold45.1/size390604/13
MQENGEATPLTTPRARRAELIWCMILPVTLITASSSLIRINQYLMKEDHFPYPFVLVMMHCFCCSSFALILLWLCPSFFPALRDPDRKVDLTARYCCTALLPIAFCFSISLVLANLAYKYCTVAFLQMIKESNLAGWIGCIRIHMGNIMLIFIMAYAAGIETFAWTKVAILCLMLVATWSCVDGEVNFNFLGFAVQVTSGVGEATKIILQSLLLSGKGTLDPMSMVLTVMPLCGMCLSCVLLFHGCVRHLSFVHLPEFTELYMWRYYLLLSSCNAFVLNVLIAMFLKYLSPVSYILTGNIKDIVVVCMSAFLIRESIEPIQFLGFSLQVLCVFAWTFYKQYGQLLPKELLEASLETEKADIEKKSNS